MAEFEPVLLANVGKADSWTLPVYEANGGYQAIRKVLGGMSPLDVIETVKASSLRGRGGAGFPTGLKWTFLPKDHPGPIYMCVNADESEPATFNNRILMEDDPHQVIEGIMLGCFATRAKVAYLYIRVEYPTAYKRLQNAINECYAAGKLGQNINGTEFSLDVYLHRGAAAYICGEETGLIESLEGKRAWPRIKPPFPAVEGAFRKPTVVNNIETLACLPHIINRGVDWFKSIGVPSTGPRDPGSYGPKLYCVSGHVEKQGCYEAPLGLTTRELVERFGGGVWKGRKGKMSVPGGVSMGLMTEAEWDVPLDFAGPGKVGCLGLGTAAVTVMDETVSIIDYLVYTSRFFAHESCGQCTPCREGTSWSERILQRIKAGKGRFKDIDLINLIGNSIGITPGTTICGLADGAAWPMKNAVAKYRGEMEEYIKKTNPSGWNDQGPAESMELVQLAH